MTSNIVLFGAEGAKLPAYLANRKELAHINADVASAAGFPVLSIKGKVFTLVKGKERKILTRPDDPDEVLQNINLTVVRANKNARVFYAKVYSEDDAEGAKPTCYSPDGVAPAADAAEPQAKKCQACKHSVWGSKAGDTGKGTACSVNTRLAVVDPESVGEPWLLRVPAGSRSNFADACKVADSRGLPYNAVVFKVGFDKEAPSPKLTFRPIGLVGDEAYDKIKGLYESDEVKDVVGLLPRRAHQEEQEAPVEADELDAALAAKSAVEKAAGKTKPSVSMEEIDEVISKPKATDDDEVEAKAKAKAKAKAAAEAEVKAKAKAAAEEAEVKVAKTETKATGGGGMDDLLGDLDDLLGSTDD